MRTLVFAVLAACGGGGSHPAPQLPHPRAPAHTSGEAPREELASVVDCDQLFDHVVQLDIDAGKLAEPDRVRVRADLASEHGAECRQQPRAVIRCAIGATTSDEVAACDQRTPSSSTSNSNVAPPGIAPGAPRSP
ncbi:MAG: hypothetical protein JO257_37850 [Deltaproteobacteria bacterium]|nr:hypothetical protein [Deltaproteobacteria bacterium]